MNPSGRKLLAPFVMLCLAVLACHAQNPAAGRALPSTISVDVKLQQWLDGYLKWVVAHPAVYLAAEQSSSNAGAISGASGGANVQATASSPGNATAKHTSNLQLHTPFVDYFAADGRSLFMDTTISENIEFLRGLPKSVSQDAKGDELQPTLSDYLDMFPELAPLKSRILALKRPVLLAICEPATPSCVRQNQALGTFKGRAAALKIEVVDLKLLRDPTGK